jgi:hypothetical protein
MRKETNKKSKRKQGEGDVRTSFAVLEEKNDVLLGLEGAKDLADVLVLEGGHGESLVAGTVDPLAAALGRGVLLHELDGHAQVELGVLAQVDLSRRAAADEVVDVDEVHVVLLHHDHVVAESAGRRGGSREGHCVLCVWRWWCWWGGSCACSNRDVGGCVSKVRVWGDGGGGDERDIFHASTCSSRRKRKSLV